MGSLGMFLIFPLLCEVHDQSLILKLHYFLLLAIDGLDDTALRMGFGS